MFPSSLLDENRLGTRSTATPHTHTNRSASNTRTSSAGKPRTGLVTKPHAADPSVSSQRTSHGFNLLQTPRAAPPPPRPAAEGGGLTRRALFTCSGPDPDPGGPGSVIDVI